jgi:hypothetical protein
MPIIYADPYSENYFTDTEGDVVFMCMFCNQILYSEDYQLIDIWLIISGSLGNWINWMSFWAPVGSYIQKGGDVVITAS